MLDFGWPELLVIIAVAVLVIGPKELPQIMRSLGRFVRRLQYMRFAITRQFDDLLSESDLEQLRKEAELSVVGEVDAEIDDDEEYLMKPMEKADGNKAGARQASRKLGKTKDDDAEAG